MRLDIKHMPELQNAVHSLVDGGQLVVISLGQFGVPRVWEWVAAALARKRASVRDLESGKIWDLAVDPGTGFEVSRLVEAMSTRLRLEKANAARAASGKLGPRQRLADEATMKCARRAWADPSLSAEKAAEKVGIGVATLYRRLGPKTEFEAKEAAKADAKAETKKTTR